MAESYGISEHKRYLKYISNAGINYESIDDITKYINDIDNIKTKRGKPITPNTKKMYLATSLWYVSNNSKNEEHCAALREAKNKLVATIRRTVKRHVLTGTQIDNYMNWSDILNVYEKVKSVRDRSPLAYKTYVLLSLYVKLCPRRLKDYALMRITDSDDNLDKNYNYYVTHRSCFVFSNYKTKKRYRTQYIGVPDELNAILKEYIEKYKVSGDLLGLTVRAIEMRLLRLFNKHAKKQVSVNILRHSYISWMIDSGKMKGNEFLVSRLMGHSMSMQKDYYKDITKIPDDDEDEEIDDSLYMHGREIMQTNDLFKV